MTLVRFIKNKPSYCVYICKQSFPHVHVDVVHVTHQFDGKDAVGCATGCRGIAYKVPVGLELMFMWWWRRQRLQRNSV